MAGSASAASGDSQDLRCRRKELLGKLARTGGRERRGEDATCVESLGARSGLGSCAAADELQGHVTRRESLAQSEPGPLPVSGRARVRRPVLGKGENTRGPEPLRELLLQGTPRSSEEIGERLRSGVRPAGGLDETDGGVEAGDGAKARRGPERGLAVLGAQGAMQVGKRLWCGGGTVAEPDIEGPPARLQDGGRFCSAAAGEVDRLGRDAGEVLDSWVERADLQSSAAVREVDQGREHLIQNVRGEDPMGHCPVERADPDLDASFPKGLELEREVVGDESSWRRDESSLCRSSGR